MADFGVKTVSLQVPGWVTPHLYTYKVTVTITFTQAANKSTVVAPDTVKISLEGLRSGRTASSIAGTVHWAPQDDKEAVFISGQSLADLIHPEAGENYRCTIKVVGKDVGAGAVTGANGEPLAGGDFTEVLEVVG
jgi:hypothetical protein